MNSAAKYTDPPNALREKFWEHIALQDMTTTEWEALCDRCGLCCLSKLECAETQEIAYTSVACKLFDDASCSCSDYAHRKTYVPHCVELSAENLADIAYWMPKTCAYRLLHEGKSLYFWHPLISGNAQSVHDAGISAQGWTVSEEKVSDDDLENYIIEK